MLGPETIKDAITDVQPRTKGVQIGSEIFTGRDSTDEDAVWVYVLVPDERIEDFYAEWDQVRDEIRRRIRDRLGDENAYVYIRMRAASEVATEP